MKVEIKINNNGEVKGCVGYFAKHATSIEATHTKNGKPLVILKDHDGNRITWLAVREDGYISTVKQNCEKGCGYEDPDFDMTEAAYESLKPLIKKAVAILEDKNIKPVVFELK